MDDCNATRHGFVQLNGGLVAPKPCESGSAIFTLPTSTFKRASHFRQALSKPVKPKIPIYNVFPYKNPIKMSENFTLGDASVSLTVALFAHKPGVVGVWAAKKSGQKYGAQNFNLPSCGIWTNC
jgi:hypothetical protein